MWQQQKCAGFCYTLCYAAVVTKVRHLLKSVSMIPETINISVICFRYVLIGLNWTNTGPTCNSLTMICMHGSNCAILDFVLGWKVLSWYLHQYYCTTLGLFFLVNTVVEQLPFRHMTDWYLYIGRMASILVLFCPATTCVSVSDQPDIPDFLS